MDLLFTASYPHPVPGFIATSVFCGAMFFYGVWRWIHAFGWHLHWPKATPDDPDYEVDI